MAIIRQGGYTENDSSDNLREKRKQIIEEERIFQLNESLMAYLDTTCFRPTRSASSKRFDDIKASTVVSL